MTGTVMPLIMPLGESGVAFWALNVEGRSGMLGADGVDW